MMKANSHCKSAAPTIGDLPDEVLALVFQQLKWRDRVRVEGVSPRWRRVALARGWIKVRDLRELEIGSMELAEHRGLLSRAGRYLTRLEMVEEDAEEEDADALLALELLYSPNLRHIAVWWPQLNEAVLSHIRNTHAMNLKSMQIRWGNTDQQDACPTLATLAATSELLSECSSLEYLVLEGETRSMLNASLRLHAPSLANLRHLHLSFIDETGIEVPNHPSRYLSAGNVEALCSLPSLHSLTLYQYGAAPDLAFLFRAFVQRLGSPHLESLEAGVSLDNLEHLVEALPRLNLRALVVYNSEGPQEPIPIALAERLILAISELKRLEYLELWLSLNYLDASGSAMQLEQAVKRFYPPLATPRLGGLRALALCPYPPPSMQPWVETLRQLEYLASTEELPLAHLCGLVQKCKKLQHVELYRPYVPSRREQKALIAAAAKRGEPEEGEEEEGNAAHIPPISIKVAKCYKHVKLSATAQARLRFVRESEYPPRIRDNYRYGALSEQPNFHPMHFFGTASMEELNE